MEQSWWGRKQHSRDSFPRLLWLGNGNSPFPLTRVHSVLPAAVSCRSPGSFLSQQVTRLFPSADVPWTRKPPTFLWRLPLALNS